MIIDITKHLEKKKLSKVLRVAKTMDDISNAINSAKHRGLKAEEIIACLGWAISKEIKTVHPNAKDKTLDLVLEYIIKETK